MKRLSILTASVAMLALAGCKQAGDAANDTAKAAESAAEGVKEAVAQTTGRTLSDILAAQPDAHKTRYQYRNPAQTLNFFEIKSGMTVAEVLPGGGWYSKILIPYLGDEGHLVGIDYSVDMWGKFGGFAGPEFLKKRKSWASTWVEQAGAWKGGSSTKLSAFAFGSAPSSLKNQVDVIFVPRAIHHLNRFEQAYLSQAMSDMKMILKPNGIIAVVAHRAAEDQPDAWAGGDNGYMKQSTVVAIMEDAGFKLVDSSEINANPKDMAKAENGDSVWRLPPSLRGAKEGTEERAKLEAIGETDRMTLKFRIK